MTTLPSRAQWNALPEREAQALLLPLLQNRLSQFELKGFERFSKFGMSSYTAVLDCAGCEFVFVPGDTVTLGLDGWTITPQCKKAMLKDVGGGEARLGQYLKNLCFSADFSPVRTAAIGPMLVERTVRETGYFPVSLEDARARLVQEETFAHALQELQTPQNSEHRIWTHLGAGSRYRLEKHKETISAFLYQPASYDQLLAEVAREGFRLPTEDEWEYLCGGGTRTLYPWGNDIDRTKNYRHENKPPYYLDTPNHFGLVIANDPYHLEVLMDSECFLKGGDGGCTFCGGACLDLAWLPASTYFRDDRLFDEDEITSDFTFIRRIIRL